MIINTSRGSVNWILKALVPSLKSGQDFGSAGFGDVYEEEAIFFFPMIKWRGDLRLWFFARLTTIQATWLITSASRGF